MPRGRGACSIEFFRLTVCSARYERDALVLSNFLHGLTASNSCVSAIFFDEKIIEYDLVGFDLSEADHARGGR